MPVYVGSDLNIKRRKNIESPGGCTRSPGRLDFEAPRTVLSFNSLQNSITIWKVSGGDRIRPEEYKVLALDNKVWRTGYVIPSILGDVPKTCPVLLAGKRILDSHTHTHTVLILTQPACNYVKIAVQMF